ILESFNPEHCSHPGQRNVASTNFAPHGDFGTLRVSPGGDSELVVADWVDQELTGLAAVNELHFARAKMGPGFICRSPLSGWDAARLNEAVKYAHEYQAFREARALDSINEVEQSGSPIYDRLARRQLKAVMDDRMRVAQQRVTLADTMQSRWLSPISGVDQRLGDRSRDFTLSAPTLKRVLGLYAQFDFNAQVIQSCARDFALSELQAADRLTEASQLYDPEQSTAALPGNRMVKRAKSSPANTSAGSASGGNFFDLGSKADTKAYLADELARAKVLTGYTKPFVQFLDDTQRSSFNKEAAATKASYWKSTVSEINRYAQGKDKKGQVGLLNDMIEKDLRGMNSGNCRERLAKMEDEEQGSGLFHARRQDLSQLTRGSCEQGYTAVARLGYRDLAKRFNAELAGLFPFGTISSPDASLRVTKQFFMDYEANRETLRANLEKANTENSSPWRNALDFLDQLDAANSFMQASLAAGAQSKPLGLNVTFRYLPDGEDGADDGSSQVLNWRLLSSNNRDEAEANYPNGAEQVNWNFGDSVTLELDWAGLSNYRPQSSDEQKSLAVSGPSASFTATGAWSLLRLIEKHRDDLIDPLNDHRLITAFKVPTKLYLPGNRTKNKPARLRLALDLLSVGADGKPGQQLELPTRFPRKAPKLR
ncbi:MAG: hypothetical protein ACPG4N_05770, partial [Gammaproteobacteria bacterium]